MIYNKLKNNNTFFQFHTPISIYIHACLGMSITIFLEKNSKKKNKVVLNCNIHKDDSGIITTFNLQKKSA